jgi:hypothetical protein
MITLYFIVFAALGALSRLLSIPFTSGIVRALRVDPEQGANDAAYHRYAARALVGVYQVPRGYLAVLCWILRGLAIIMFAGLAGALYIAFSSSSGRPDCLECNLDPASKTLAFWLGYGAALVLLLSVYSAMLMILRWDPRQVETGALVDARRLNLAGRMIFTDRLIPHDPLARALRHACRWGVLIASIALIACVSLASLEA